MRWIRLWGRIALSVGLASPLPQAFGGGVITANLPANTAIVNISGTQDGAATFSGANATNLLPSAWRDVTHVPAVISTNFSVTLPLDAASRFFRLHNP